jgi:hypothetical protein
MAANKYKKRKSGGAALKVLMTFGLSSILIGAVALYAWTQFGEPKTDPDTFCPVNGASALTVIAIDATDPFDAVQRREIDNRVRRLLGEMERGHRLDIYTMDAGRQSLASRVFSKCNPGRQATRLDRVAGQPTRVERRYREEFAAAITQALEVTIESGAANQSPIVESVRAIAADALGDVAGDVPGRLIIVSDLVQHSDIYSMFRSGVGQFDDFSRSPNYLAAQTNLHGADVELVVILRPEYARFQNRALIQWWEEYIRANDGRLADFVRI